MLNEQTLKAIRGALWLRLQSTQSDTEMMASSEQAMALVDSLLAGTTIASLWSVDDVYEANGDCVIEQISKDGEDDGLTWFHCDTHDLDTLDTQFCEEHPPICTEAMAIEVLRLADHNHDANEGISWEVLKSWIYYVRENGVKNNA